jgi:hypothetical protein
MNHLDGTPSIIYSHFKYFIQRTHKTIIRRFVLEHGTRKCYSEVWIAEDTCIRENLGKMDTSEFVPWHFPDDEDRDVPWNFSLLSIQNPDVSASPTIFCYILTLSTSLALDSRFICCFDAHQPFRAFRQRSVQLALRALFAFRTMIHSCFLASSQLSGR